MAYASRAGRARTSSRSPQAHAICDRCGGRYNHVNLSWQFDWAGAKVVNRRILVCAKCIDRVNPQLRSLIIPADPVPIRNPRPEDFIGAATNYRVTSGQNTVNAETGIPVPGGDFRITEVDDLRVTQQTGAAQGSLNNEPGTDPSAPGNDDPGLPPGNIEVPKVS